MSTTKRGTQSFTPSHPEAGGRKAAGHKENQPSPKPPSVPDTSRSVIPPAPALSLKVPSTPIPPTMSGLVIRLPAPAEKRVRSVALKDLATSSNQPPRSTTRTKDGHPDEENPFNVSRSARNSPKAGRPPAGSQPGPPRTQDEPPHPLPSGPLHPLPLRPKSSSSRPRPRPIKKPSTTVASETDSGPSVPMLQPSPAIQDSIPSVSPVAKSTAAKTRADRVSPGSNIVLLYNTPFSHDSADGRLKRKADVLDVDIADDLDRFEDLDEFEGADKFEEPDDDFDGNELTLVDSPGIVSEQKKRDLDALAVSPCAKPSMRRKSNYNGMLLRSARIADLHTSLPRLEQCEHELRAVTAYAENLERSFADALAEAHTELADARRASDALQRELHAAQHTIAELRAAPAAVRVTQDALAHEDLARQLRAAEAAKASMMIQRQHSLAERDRALAVLQDRLTAAANQRDATEVLLIRAEANAHDARLRLSAAEGTVDELSAQCQSTTDALDEALREKNAAQAALQRGKQPAWPDLGDARFALPDLFQAMRLTYRHLV